ncbi:telomerase reverse transcriptase isoform X2 [Dendrobium catenatum]|uniref:telomerase reverse transcriptase isoform X2 n=1 Tax=Dendrobium catenatum TaxID=906689 RepID=UPI00109FBADF|nr:telomerase reverse transcriptase isoform X2 [Dendrobium catenatum]
MSSKVSRCSRLQHVSTSKKWPFRLSNKKEALIFNEEGGRPMARRRRRRPRIPEVLKRACGCRVNTLECSILSLLPTPPPDSPLDCSCNGRLCLGCLGQSHLVCDEDPSDYLRFLTNSFCFVSPSAPPPPTNFSTSGLGLRYKNGFFADRAINCSHVFDQLLERIGDELMTFLLCYSSIFVPLANHNYLQVTGDPLKGLLEVPEDKGVPSLKIGDTGELSSPCNDVSENSSFHLHSRKRRRDFSWKRRRKRQKVSYPCLDCIVWHSPCSPELGTYIERNFMFYARPSAHSMFPRQHILNRLKPTKSGAISLLNHIFGVSANDIDSQELNSSLNLTKSKVTCSCFKASNSKCLLHSLIGLFKALIRNSQRCQYKKLLRRHCLNPAINKNKAICDGSELEHDLIDSYSSHKQVVSFVWAITRSLVPNDLLGDYITWRALRKNISKFVKLRRFERFSLKQCMHKLKSSHYPFLSKIAFSNCSCGGLWKNYKNYRKRKKDLRALSVGNRSLQNKLFRCWLYWYFSHVVVPLLGNNFYVTERETRKLDVFYYPRPTWNKLFKSTVAQLKGTTYGVLDHASLHKILSERRITLGGSAFGFSRVRFLPKEKNVRPLANLRAPSKFQFTDKKNARIHVKAVKEQSRFVWYKSVNSSLRELYVALRSIKADDPNKLGASVFDYNEIYRRLYHFVVKVRKRSAFFPKLYIVVADVAKAYDSIDQDVLIDIMNDVIPCDTYFFKNYSKLVCDKKSIKAMPYRLCSYHCNKKQDIMKIEASIQLNSSCCVFIDKGTSVEVSNQMLHRVLAEHLKHNILQIGHDYYLQEVGISQGSILSSLLCSFYYGHLEREVILPFLEKAYKISSRTENIEPDYGANENCGSQLSENAWSHSDSTEVFLSGKPMASNLTGSDINCADEGNQCTNNLVAVSYSSGFKIDKPQNLLLRFVDDFLFISTSKQQAASFFSRLRRGFRAFNCYMNFEKFGLNFDMEEPSLSSLSMRFYTGADGMQFIPWSGLLINCENLEIQADYTRYWGIHVSSTITIQASAKPGCTLEKKLCNYIRPKCYPLLYDSNINSLKTVALNAYQAFLLSAMKFHCSVCFMPSISKLNPSYIFGKILFSFRYMYKLLKKRMHNVENRFNLEAILKLKKMEIIWLGLSAFVRVLKKKQSRYKELIHLLRNKIDEIRLEGAVPYLRYAVEDSHSSLFWKIRF